MSRFRRRAQMTCQGWLSVRREFTLAGIRIFG